MQNITKILMTSIVAITIVSFGFSNTAMAGTVDTAQSTATMDIPAVCGVDIATATDLGFGSAAQNDVITRLLALENLGTADSQLVTMQGATTGWTEVSTPFTSHITVGNTSFDDGQSSTFVAFDGTAQSINDLDAGGADSNIDIRVNVQLIALPVADDLQFQIDLVVSQCGV